MGPTDVAVLFACKMCARFFKKLNEFVDHKKQKHFLEFRKSRCIIFEECEKSSEDGTVKLPHGRSISTSEALQPSSNGSLVLRSGENKILRDPQINRVPSSSNLVNGKSDTYASGTNEDGNNSNSTTVPNPVQSMAPVPVPVPARYVLSTRLMQQDQFAKSKLQKHESKADENRNHTNHSHISQIIIPLSPIPINWKRNAPEKMKLEPKAEILQKFDTSDFKRGPDPRPGPYSKTYSSGSTDKSAIVVSQNLCYQCQGHCKVSPTPSDPSDLFSFDPSSLLKVDWAESEIDVEIQGSQADQEEGGSNPYYSKQFQFQFNFNFVPHFLSQLCMDNSFTGTGPNDATETETDFLANKKLKSCWEESIPSAHRNPCVQLRNLSLREIKAASFAKNACLPPRPTPSPLKPKVKAQGRPKFKCRCHLLQFQNKKKLNSKKYVAPSPAQVIRQKQNQIRCRRKRKRPYQCYICKASFCFSNVLANHMATHFNYKPFKCQNVNCSAAFKTRGALRHHKAHFKSHAKQTKLQRLKSVQTSSSVPV